MDLKDKIYFLREELEAAVLNPLIRPKLWYRAGKGIIGDSRSHDWVLEIDFLWMKIEFRAECTRLITELGEAEYPHWPRLSAITALEKVVVKLDDCLKAVTERSEDQEALDWNERDYVIDYLPNKDLMYMSKEEEELMIAALEKVESWKGPKYSNQLFEKNGPLVNRLNVVWRARLLPPPPQIDCPKSNDPSSTPENVVAVNASEVGLVVGSKRKYSETGPGISAEVKEDPNPTDNGHSDLGKGVSEP
ncbi:hypothetical protein HOLleu_14740 [Holothuria leucospilota]|uniref:Uncharacterized protein n=1 Tax=Holothuria leucospilota TaxID=206669 RepID=A0A9Q1C957_HOLLE|nr:hypothetical protein HOLleu_14740 [Holothuria leucospilota]